MPVGSVIHYCGHRDRSESDERWERIASRDIAKNLKSTLESYRPLSMHGSLAAGADILFAEYALQLDIPLYVYLPFSSKVFIRSSVLPAGKNWLDRYEAILPLASRVLVLDPAQINYNDDEPYRRVTKLALDKVSEFAREQHATALQLTINDPSREYDSAPSMTSLDIQDAKAMGISSINIISNRKQ